MNLVPKIHHMLDAQIRLSCSSLLLVLVLNTFVGILVVDKQAGLVDIEVAVPESARAPTKLVSGYTCLLGRCIAVADLDIVRGQWGGAHAQLGIPTVE